MVHNNYESLLAKRIRDKTEPTRHALNGKRIAAKLSIVYNISLLVKSDLFHYHNLTTKVYDQHWDNCAWTSDTITSST